MKFLKATGQYNLMFSNYYIVSKDASTKRDASKIALMQKIAGKRYVKPEMSDSGSSDEDNQNGTI